MGEYCSCFLSFCPFNDHTVVPKIGDKSGYLLLKKVPRGGKKKSSLRRAGKEGVRKFVVVEVR